MTTALIAGARVAPGKIITLQSTFQVGGTLTDLSTITVDVYNESGELEFDDLTPHHISLGRYEIDVRIPGTADAGTWRVQWNGETDTLELYGADYIQVVDTEDTGETLDAWAIALRVRLKDTDPRNYAFSTVEINEFLDLALADVNVWPTFTEYTWTDVPTNWKSLVTLGGQVMALYAQGLIEAGREFTVTDQGISFNPPQLSAHMQTAAQALMTQYNEMKEVVKRNIRPSYYAVGSYRVLAIHPYMLRLRHLRERRLV